MSDTMSESEKMALSSLLGQATRSANSDTKEISETCEEEEVSEIKGRISMGPEGVFSPGVDDEIVNKDTKPECENTEDMDKKKANPDQEDVKERAEKEIKDMPDKDDKDMGTGIELSDIGIDTDISPEEIFGDMDLDDEEEEPEIEDKEAEDVVADLEAAVDDVKDVVAKLADEKEDKEDEDDKDEEDEEDEGEEDILDIADLDELEDEEMPESLGRGDTVLFTDNGQTDYGRIIEHFGNKCLIEDLEGELIEVESSALIPLCSDEDLEKVLDGDIESVVDSILEKANEQAVKSLGKKFKS